MTRLLTMLLTLMFVSCSHNSHKNVQHNTSTNPTADSISGKIDFDFYSDSILTQIDAEELCEFNFDFFLPQLNQILADKEVKLEVQSLDEDNSTFEIILNGHQLKLYTPEELSNGKFWDTGPRNFFRKVNDILKEKDIEEKFYLLYDGNDLQAVFLTEQQFEFMVNSNKDDPNEIPYRP